MVCFARTHSYPFVFPQLTKVVFNQIPPFVGLLVEVCWEPAVGFWRYERGDVAGQKVISQPIRIEGPIRQKMSGCQVADQCVGLA